MDELLWKGQDPVLNWPLEPIQIQIKDNELIRNQNKSNILEWKTLWFRSIADTNAVP